MGDNIVKRLFTSLLIITLVILAALLSVGASASTSRIYDGADILDDSERAELESALARAEEECGVAIRVYIGTEYMPGIRKILSAFSMTEESDVVILSVECLYGEYFYEILAYGKGDSLLSYDDSDDILDADSVYYNLKGGNILDGAQSFASMTTERISTNRNTQFFALIAWTVILPLVAAGIFIGVTVYRYKRKLKSPIYPVSDYAKLDLRYATDNFTGSHVSRVRIQSSSGGRGGGGRSGSRGRR